MVEILVYTGGTKVAYALSGKLKESMLISGRYLKIDSQIYNKKQILIIDPPNFEHFERKCKILSGHFNDLVETLGPPACTQ